MNYSSELDRVNMIEYNGIGNFDNPTIYRVTFQNLVKSGKYEMIFIFKDENEVMYYNHDCFTEIKICHDNCEKCDVIHDVTLQNI